MIFEIKKRNFIRILSFSLALIISGFGGWIYSENRARMLRRELVHKYEASLEEVADGVKNMATLLSKSLYVGTPYGMCSLTGELEALSGSIEGAMASFPSSLRGSAEISKFVNQVSDFSGVLLKQSLSGEEITKNERQSLKRLAQSAESMSKHLDEALTVYNTNENWQKRVEGILQKIEVSDELDDNISEMAETLNSAPSLIYDGPFSDHIESKEPLLTKNAKQMSLEKAKEIAQEYISEIKGELKLSGEEEGKIPAYCFADEESYISVAKSGGYVKYFRKNKNFEGGEISYDKAVEIAKKFLKDKLEKEFKETYFFTEENVCVINFAFLQGEVLCYPDLVKVGVSMDSGEVVFYEAVGYIMNHKPRTFSEPKHSPLEAQKAVSEHLKIRSSKLVIIPTESGTENLCYEFLCVGESNEEILVYINVESLAEENILILLKTDGGTLTK